MQAYAEKRSFYIDDEFISYAYAVATKYGEASGALAAQMYDELSEYWDVVNAPAEVAETPSYNEVAKAIQGTAKTSPRSTPSTVSRMVKQVGADTMLKNAIRDGAYFAWVPGGGETCAFCLTLASRGWQRASEKALKNGHAEHIHGHCKCTYAIAFNEKQMKAYKGYEPDKYLEMYTNAEGSTPEAKIRAMRRMLYKDVAESRNARRRELYAEKKKNSRFDNLPNQFIGNSNLKKIQTGAKNYFRDESRDMFMSQDELKKEKHAYLMYDTIKNSNQEIEVDKIYSNIKGKIDEQFSKEDVQIAFDHVFNIKHELYDGKHLFTPDYEMAQSWNRLISGGNIQEKDLILIQHERLEHEYMYGEKKLKYDDAHNLTNEKFNYSILIKKEK